MYMYVKKRNIHRKYTHAYIYIYIKKNMPYLRHISFVCSSSMILFLTAMLIFLQKSVEKKNNETRKKKKAK